MSFPFNNLAHRGVCVGVLLLLAGGAMMLAPRATNLNGESLATFSRRGVSDSTLLTDLAHYPAAGERASIPLARVGDQFLFGGHSQVDLAAQTMRVTPSATVGQLLRWVRGVVGFDVYARPPRWNDPPQFQYGAPTMYRFEVIHPRPAGPVLIAGAVAMGISLMFFWIANRG